MALKVVKRQAKRITDPKDIEYLLAITEDECTKLSLQWICLVNLMIQEDFNLMT